MILASVVQTKNSAGECLLNIRFSVPVVPFAKDKAVLVSTPGVMAGVMTKPEDKVEY